MFSQSFIFIEIIDEEINMEEPYLKINLKTSESLTCSDFFRESKGFITYISTKCS